jgi:2-oxoglutarate dehydrogenase E2 component (dihydrolipoamide succinyltransferase)
MAIDIKVPAVGESITEGTLARWLKKDGDFVKADEPLFELETEKATTEIAALASGRLVIRVREGETVPIGAVVGQIEEKAGAPVPAGNNKKKQEADKQPQLEAVPRARGAASPTPSKSSAEPAVAAADQALLSPSVRRLVREEGIDVRELSGTGRGGRITTEDVQHYLDEHKPHPEEAGRPSAPPSPPLPPVLPEQAPAPPSRRVQAPADRETRERMSPIRQRIADRLVAAQKTAAILTTFNEADLSAVLSLRTQYKDLFREKHGVHLGFMGFFVKACIEALRAFPRVNARIDGSDIVYQHFYNIGIAVSTDKGLMVPIVRDAERLSLPQIEKALAELAAKARDGKITVNDLQGGTFTITNGGVFGSLLSTPILNPPQSGILGMHAIQKRPVAVNDQVVIRPMMYLAFSYDHRLIDGREAVQFLVRVKECVERPERLLLEI